MRFVAVRAVVVGVAASCGWRIRWWCWKIGEVMEIEGKRFGRGCGNRSILGFSFPRESDREAEGRDGLTGSERCWFIRFGYFMPFGGEEDEDRFSLYGP